jgi:hypothetical protein
MEMLVSYQYLPSRFKESAADARFAVEAGIQRLGDFHVSPLAGSASISNALLHAQPRLIRHSMTGQSVRI